MISQRTVGVPYVVQRYACYTLVLGRMVEYATGGSFELPDVLGVLLDGIYHEYLDHELTVQKPDRLLQLYVETAGAQKWQRLYQIGADGTYWGWVKNKRVDYTALKYCTVNDTPEDRHFHFLLGNDQGHAIWNPDPKVKLADLESIIYYQCKHLVD